MTRLYLCDFYFVRDWEARLRAEFIDGSIWESKTAPYKCSELRSIFYEKCSDVEDKLDREGVDEEEEDLEMDYSQKPQIKGTKKGKQWNEL